jgi:hypothetical protein
MEEVREVVEYAISDNEFSNIVSGLLSVVKGMVIWTIKIFIMR